MKLSRILSTVATGLGLTLFSCLAATQAFATPAEEALETLRNGPESQNVVQNRFFLKTGRFEIAPVGGFVPNDPMVSRILGGFALNYHFSEEFSASSQIFYSPDLGTGDLKGLTNTLVQIANSGTGGVSFQQPVDKIILGATFSAQWAPVYGKINLLGESVLNFDVYLQGGLGLLTLQRGYARYNAGAVQLDRTGIDVMIPASVGFGVDFFLNQRTALKLDVRNLMYVGAAPDYSADDGVASTESRLYQSLIVSTGISFYFPNMSPRLTDF